MEELTRRRLLAGMGLTLGGVSCFSGLKNVFATKKDLFSKYPLALDIPLQSSFQGRITGLYSTTYELEKRIQEYDAVATFFQQPVIVLSEGKESGTERMHVQDMEMVWHTWLRDLFLFSERSLLLSPRIFSDGTGLLNGNLYHRAKQIEDSAVYFAEKEKVNLAVAPCPFEGGQVLKAGKHTLVPEFWSDIRNLEVLAAMRPDMYGRIHSEEDIRHFYEQVFGPIIFVPNYFQEFATFSGHLDVYVTPVSTDTILVGDIGLADEILSGEDFQRIREFEKRIEEKVELYPPKQGPVNIRDVDSELKKPFKDVLDRAAVSLSQFYKVKRIPFALIQLGYEPAFLSYNNALVEEARKKALVPEFGLACLEKEVAAIFASENYFVQGIDSTEGIFRKYGPHCMYLERRKL